MRKYTQLDGYKATTGYTIQQDANGYLWMGTDNGGVRFDGKTFKELQPIHHLVNPEVLTCSPLQYNRVILVPITGDVCILDHDTVINSAKDPRLRKQQVRNYNSIAKSIRTGVLWMWDGSIQDSLYLFDGKLIKRFANKSENFSIYYVIDDYLVGLESTSRYLGFYDIRSDKLQYFYHQDGTVIDSVKEGMLKMSSSLNKVLTYEHRKQLLHVYEWDTKDTILKEINRFTFPLKPYFMLFSSYTRQQKQCFFYHMPDNRIAYCPDINDKNAKGEILYLTIPGTIKSYFVDDHSNIWLSSADNALYFLSEKHTDNGRLSMRVPLHLPIPRCIIGINGQLCVSYPNSTKLSFLSATGPKQFQLNDHFNIGPRNIETFDDSNIFFYEAGIGVLNIRTNKIIYIDQENGCIKDICLYKESGILAASCRGVHLIKKHNGKYSTPKIIFERRSTAVKVTTQDQILIGTTEGLYRKNGLDKDAIQIDHPLLKKECITDILLTDDSNALIGTNSGLFLYHLTGGVKALKDSAPSHFIPLHIRQLYRQDHNVFWVATDEGACMITLNNKWQLQSVKNYTFYEGLPSNNVTSIYTWQDTAYIATAEGLGVIPIKDSAIFEMLAPRMYIDVLQAGPHSFSTPEQQVTLPDDRSELRIMLNAISYESLGNVQYYYRLNPLQSEWIQTAEPEVRFTRLPAGSYVFEAFATNAKGIESKIVRLEIYIKPAFWQTIYFKAALGLIALGLFFVLIRWQLKRSGQKRYRILQQKKHLAELELEAIKAQINPHFIYNCLNSIQYLNYKADHEQAQLYLGMFSRLIRMTLKYSQRTFIPVTEEVAYLSAYLQMEQLRFKDKLQYKIDIDHQLEQNTPIPAMLLQPYVENALKHGVAALPLGGTIRISFRKESEDLEIIIKDNGPGFSDQQSADTLGLRLSATRAQTYNDLFNMHIIVYCHNEQESDPLRTGAVIKIIIKHIKKWKDQLSVQSS